MLVGPRYISVELVPHKSPETGVVGAEPFPMLRPAVVVVLAGRVSLPVSLPPTRGKYVLDADEVVRYELIPLIVWYVEAALAVVR